MTNQRENYVDYIQHISLFFCGLYSTYLVMTATKIAVFTWKTSNFNKNTKLDLVYLFLKINKHYRKLGLLKEQLIQKE